MTQGGGGYHVPCADGGAARPGTQVGLGCRVAVFHAGSRLLVVPIPFGCITRWRIAVISSLSPRSLVPPFSLFVLLLIQISDWPASGLDKSWFSLVFFDWLSLS